MTWPTIPKAIKARIASYRRILRQEAASPGGFGDGRGKRFLLITLYFQLREDDEAQSYIDWYRATFPEDHGHAESFLCWALILHRLGREDEAVYRFVQAVDNNLPVVADVVGDLHAPYGIRGEEIWQISRVDPSVRAAMTAEELAWLRSNWRSPTVAAMRERYIANQRAYVAAMTPAERIKLHQDTDALVQAFKPAEMPPLTDGTMLSWIEDRGRAEDREAEGGERDQDERGDVAAGVTKALRGRCGRTDTRLMFDPSSTLAFRRLSQSNDLQRYHPCGARKSEVFQRWRMTGGRATPAAVMALAAGPAALVRTVKVLPETARSNNLHRWCTGLFATGPHCIGRPLSGGFWI